jgi:hypothetical protein
MFAKLNDFGIESGPVGTAFVQNTVLSVLCYTAIVYISNIDRWYSDHLKIIS